MRAFGLLLVALPAFVSSAQISTGCLKYLKETSTTLSEAKQQLQVYVSKKDKFSALVDQVEKMSASPLNVAPSADAQDAKILQSLKSFDKQVAVLNDTTKKLIGQPDDAETSDFIEALDILSTSSKSMLQVCAGAK